MQTLGQILGMLYLVGMFLGILPLSGWINWLNLLLVVTGLIISIARGSTGDIILCAAAIFFVVIVLIRFQIVL